MTKKQIELARHALGLDHYKMSYRNRYSLYSESDNWAAWQGMVTDGNAKVSGPHDGLMKMHLFEMTLQGAQVVLLPGEKLSVEDFPALKKAKKEVSK